MLCSSSSSKLNRAFHSLEENNKSLNWEERISLMRAYFDMNGNRYWVVISEFNTKMGPVPSFSTPSVITCPKGLPCYGACYARAYEEKRDTVHLSYCNNLKMLLEFPDIVRDKIVAYINLTLEISPRMAA